MSNKTTITVGRSVQVFQIGMPESWTKISVSKDFPEDVNVQLAIDDLFLEVEKAHGKHSVSDDAGNFNFTPKKKKMDVDTLRRYMEAIRINNKSLIDQIQSEYDVIS